MPFGKPLLSVGIFPKHSALELHPSLNHSYFPKPMLLTVFAYHKHTESKYAALPSRLQPSSCAGSFSCCPRCRETTKYEQAMPSTEDMSPHNFSY